MTIEETAQWVKHNSIINKAVSSEQAEHIDWVAVVRNSKLWNEE